MRCFGVSLVLSLLMQATAAVAADPAVVCQSSKLKEAGKYGACRLSASAKAVKKGSVADFAKCEAKFSGKWLSAETKAGSGVCPSDGDAVSIGERVEEHADDLAILLGGGDLPPASGCEGPQVAATGQTQSYGAGDDGDVQAGEPLVFQDNGDGTITDPNTGLMWEKKVAKDGAEVLCADATGSCANPHDADNYYRWTEDESPRTAFSGEVVAIFLDQLNNRCDSDTTIACAGDEDCSGPGGPCGFAGYRDWRLPQVKELASILDYSHPYGTASVASAFHASGCDGSCTDLSVPDCSCEPGRSWTSTTSADYPNTAWTVDTFWGALGTWMKDDWLPARAVRGN